MQLRVVARGASVVGLLIVGSCGPLPEPGYAPAELRRLVGPTRPIEIEARGARFTWRFRYPGPDGKLGNDDDVFGGKDLRLPPRTAIQLSIESDDYVYTLSSPELGLKQLAVPGLTHALSFQTPAAGSYELAADPMCGRRLEHEDFMGSIRIESSSESQVRTD